MARVNRLTSEELEETRERAEKASEGNTNTYTEAMTNEIV